MISAQSLARGFLAPPGTVAVFQKNNSLNHTILRIRKSLEVILTCLESLQTQYPESKKLHEVAKVIKVAHHTIRPETKKSFEPIVLYRAVSFARYIFRQAHMDDPLYNDQEITGLIQYEFNVLRSELIDFMPSSDIEHMYDFYQLDLYLAIALLITRIRRMPQRTEGWKQFEQRLDGFQHDVGDLLRRVRAKEKIDDEDLRAMVYDIKKDFLMCQFLFNQLRDRDPNTANPFKKNMGSIEKILALFEHSTQEGFLNDYFLLTIYLPFLLDASIGQLEQCITVITQVVRSGCEMNLIEDNDHGVFEQFFESGEQVLENLISLNSILRLELSIDVLARPFPHQDRDQKLYILQQKMFQMLADGRLFLKQAVRMIKNNNHLSFLTVDAQGEVPLPEMLQSTGESIIYVLNEVNYVLGPRKDRSGYVIRRTHKLTQEENTESGLIVIRDDDSTDLSYISRIEDKLYDVRLRAPLLNVLGDEQLWDYKDVLEELLMLSQDLYEHDQEKVRKKAENMIRVIDQLIGGPGVKPDETLASKFANLSNHLPNEMMLVSIRNIERRLHDARSLLCDLIKFHYIKHHYIQSPPLSIHSQSL
ncbi:MAG: hypothetical protein GF384_05280 [Elusimicrobia bacterium]|nr:hypothetical protein [Elusimicrobiota bacterium]MBD3412201.1 hypothetical protein [Elusimicrobiota bacterium]